MESFTFIVSICSGLSIIAGAITLFVKPIRERVLQTKEKENAQNTAIKDLDSKVDALTETVNTIITNQDIDNAKRNRSQILRFADDLYKGVKFSREHFQNIMDCETEYNRYCVEHPEFINKRTEQAQRTIDRAYDECEKNHTFLDKDVNN